MMITIQQLFGRTMLNIGKNAFAKCQIGSSRFEYRVDRRNNHPSSAGHRGAARETSVLRWSLIPSHCYQVAHFIPLIPIISSVIILTRATCTERIALRIIYRIYIMIYCGCTLRIGSPPDTRATTNSHQSIVGSPFILLYIRIIFF